MPGLDMFRRSMPHSYSWTCKKGAKVDQTQDDIASLDHRRRSLDKAGRRDNLKSMGRSIQHLLVMKKGEEIG